MLARIADNLFWMSRYMERADYVARLLQVAGHMSAVRPEADSVTEWESVIVAAGAKQTLPEDFEVSETAVVQHLAFDPNYHSSIVSCIETARRNARAVRTALNTEAWEAVNGTWYELRQFSGNLSEDERIRFLDWVKSRVGLFQGVYANTTLRLDSYHFFRIGQFLERADNTARLLDVKYHVRLPRAEDVGGVIDYYQWLAILRVVAARRAYRVLFQGKVQPAQVADLLVLRSEFPRSLRFCFERIVEHLEMIQAQDPRRVAEAKKLAQNIHTQLKYSSIDELIALGLHEYLSDIVERISELGASIARAHHF